MSGIFVEAYQVHYQMNNSSPNEQADVRIMSGCSNLTPPVKDVLLQGGQTVFSAQMSEEASKWFAVRATQGRARKVYDSLLSLNDDSVELYLPVLKRIVYSNADFDHPSKEIVEELMYPNLLFMRCTLERMLYYLYDDQRPRIPGFTPYYNHCIVDSNGKNGLLVVPDVQLQSFRIIVESGNEYIILNENVDSEFLDGDRVEVTGGPFAGVQGVLVRYRRHRRVMVQLDGIGLFGTSYMPNDWIRKIS